MNKRITLLSLLLLVAATLYAQTSRKYGVVSKEDLDYNSFPGDPEATAVIMFHTGNVKYVDTGQYLHVKSSVTKRIKILSEAGLSKAEVSIFYYSDGYGKTEKVEEIQATCHNWANGRFERKELSAENIFDEKVNDKWHKKTFSIPGVKVGSIIEFKYDHISPFVTQLTDWEFQSDIPTVHSSLAVALVPFYEYVTVSQGIEKFDRRDSHEVEGLERTFAGVNYRELVHEFELNDVPAFYDDDYITSKNDYIKKIDFQLAQINKPSGEKVKYMTTWEELADELRKSHSFGKYVKIVEKMAKSQLLPTLGLTGRPQQEQVQIITDYVKDNYKWNGYLGKYASQTAKSFHKTMTGNSGDINLFLLGMLRGASIKANPVILSTRSHGKVKVNYPFSSHFNMVAVVAEIPEGILSLDATNRTLPFYLLSKRCLNGIGLLVDEENLSFMNLTPSFFSSIKENTTITIDTATMETNYITNERSTRYYAANNRRLYNRDEDQFFESRLGDAQELTSHKIENLDDRESAFVAKYSKSNPIEQFKGDLYLYPMSTAVFDSNPFLNKKRDYPVDFIYQKQRIYATTILCPAGYQIKTTPDNLKLDNEMLSFDYKFTPLSGGQNLRFEATFVTKQAIYEVEQYEELKTLFKQVYAQMSKKVVFEKI